MRQTVLIMTALVTPFWVLLACLWLGMQGNIKTAFVLFSVFSAVWTVTLLIYLKDGNKNT